MGITFSRLLRNQRGAMFGLDARIALGIFGGLSVIAGAAVFGTISETNRTALVTEMDNIAKGYINHVFDTGVQVRSVATMTTANADASFNYLITNVGSTLNWNGPYVTASSNDHPRYGNYGVLRGRIDATGVPDGTCATGICGAWLRISTVPDEVIDAVDLAIDGGASADRANGNCRADNTAATQESIYYLMTRM